MLAGVDSDDPNDSDVAYAYRGDLKRVWRSVDGVPQTAYNLDAGFNVVSEEDVGSPNTLARTYIAGLAEIIGSNPATGTPRYLTPDHLGSTRGVFSGTKASLGTFEYTPYGMPYAFTGPPDITRLFTGHDLDAITGNYFAPFRYLNPDAGRWLKQDPLGMINGPNMYAYVGGNPTNFFDPLGLFITTGGYIPPGGDSPFKLPCISGEDVFGFAGGLIGAGIGAALGAFTGGVVGGIAGLGLGAAGGFLIAGPAGAPVGGTAGMFVGGMFGAAAAAPFGLVDGYRVGSNKGKEIYHGLAGILRKLKGLFN